MLSYKYFTNNLHIFFNAHKICSAKIFIYLCNYARLYKVLCIFSEHSPGTDDKCTIAAITDGPWILALEPWSLVLGSLVKSCPGPFEDGVILKGQKVDQLLVY